MNQIFKRFALSLFAVFSLSLIAAPAYADTVVTQIDNRGHAVKVTVPDGIQSAIVGTGGVSAGDVVCVVNDTGPKIVTGYTNTSTGVECVSGIALDTALATASARWIPSGQNSGAIYSGLTIGQEYYSDANGGLPVAFSALSSNDFTRRVCIATAANACVTALGSVVQKP